MHGSPNQTQAHFQALRAASPRAWLALRRRARLGLRVGQPRGDVALRGLRRRQPPLGFARARGGRGGARLRGAPRLALARQGCNLILVRAL